MRVTGPEGGVQREDMVAGLDVVGWGGLEGGIKVGICKVEVMLRVGEG